MPIVPIENPMVGWICPRCGATDRTTKIVADSIGPIFCTACKGVDCGEQEMVLASEYVKPFDLSTIDWSAFRDRQETFMILGYSTILDADFVQVVMDQIEFMDWLKEQAVDAGVDRTVVYGEDK